MVTGRAIVALLIVYNVAEFVICDKGMGLFYTINTVNYENKRLVSRTIFLCHCSKVLNDICDFCGYYSGYFNVILR